MHDPLVVAFTIRRPWPKGRLTKGKRWWPPMVTVWHREPNGHDSGEVCKHYVKRRRPDGSYGTRILHGWKFHVHHWRVQVHALQGLRRRLLTRCVWCGGRSTRRDAVNHSLSWDGPGGRWWQGEPGVYHADCASVARAHGQCTCIEPQCRDFSQSYGPYGSCARCGKGRSFGKTEAQMVRMRMLAAVPMGRRDRGVYERVCDMATAERARGASL